MLEARFVVGLYRKKKVEEEAQSGFQRECKEGWKEVKKHNQRGGGEREREKKKKKKERGNPGRG